MRGAAEALGITAAAALPERAITGFAPLSDMRQSLFQSSHVVRGMFHEFAGTLIQNKFAPCFTSAPAYQYVEWKTKLVSDRS